MKILKPDNLALVYRGLRLARRDVLSIGMIAGFRFDDAGLDGLMPEPDVRRRGHRSCSSESARGSARSASRSWSAASDGSMRSA
jgi:hypothetical protein